MSHRQLFIRRKLVLRQFLSCSMFLGTAFLASAPVAAVLLDWDGNESVDGNFDGDFDVANNWNPDQIPAAGDVTNFNASATYTVTFTADEEADELRVVAGEATFLSDSATVRTFDIVTGNMDANVSGGKLTVGSDDNPVVVNVGDIMNIGSNASGANEVAVDGLFSALNAGVNTHNIGRNGRNGSLFLMNRGTATYGGTLRIGVDNGSTGYVSASTGGKLNTGNIEIGTVGVGGTGSIQVTESGSWINQSIPGSTLMVGSAAGNSGSITAAKGGKFTTGTGLTRVDATGIVNVGLAGDGILEVLGDIGIIGGALNVGGDVGDVFSLGIGQTLTAKGAAIDFGGAYTIDGTFDIQDATFDIGGALTLSATGTLNLDGGSLNANAGLDASNGVLLFLDGTLTVTGGAFLPNAGGPLDDFWIDGPTAAEMPHLVLGTGATANIGDNLFVGAFNRGELTISGGATVSSNSAFIGSEVGSIGTATVDGLGSTWTNSGDFYVGYFGGIGTLNIQNGGAVSSTNLVIASTIGATGTVTVDGADANSNPSIWTNSGGVRVGESGIGTLNIQNGGAVSNTFAYIGAGSFATGDVTVDGVGSTWTNSQSLFLGGHDIAAGGTASLTVADDGLVSVGDTLKIWDQGTLTLDGGHVVTDTFDNASGGSFNWLAGSLTINSGVVVGSSTPFPVNLTLSRSAIEVKLETGIG